MDMRIEWENVKPKTKQKEATSQINLRRGIEKSLSLSILFFIPCALYVSIRICPHIDPLTFSFFSMAAGKIEPCANCIVLRKPINIPSLSFLLLPSLQSGWVSSHKKVRDKKKSKAIDGQNVHWTNKDKLIHKLYLFNCLSLYVSLCSLSNRTLYFSVGRWKRFYWISRNKSQAKKFRLQSTDFELWWNVHRHLWESGKIIWASFNLSVTQSFKNDLEFQKKSSTDGHCIACYRQRPL